MTQTQAMVVLSGGQDSTTALFWAGTQFNQVKTVTFDYGQRHLLEVQAAFRIATLANIVPEVVRMGPVLKGMSPLTNSDAELETYKDYETMNTIIGNRVEKTFVPMRNAFFLVLAANRAIAQGINNLVTGICQADGANYPDCRMSFLTSMRATIEEALGQDFYIHCPLIDLKKSEIVKLSLTMPGCYRALAYSHTAYDGIYPPTGRDHASVLRAHGFEEARVPDPLVLRAVLEGEMKMPTTFNYWGVNEIVSALHRRDDLDIPKAMLEVEQYVRDHCK